MNYEKMIENWKSELPLFKEKTEQFLKGDISKAEYKGFSGRYGCYAQRDQKHFMLRLRTPAGRITKKSLNFLSEICQKYDIETAHHTTCQTLQLHNLTKEQLFSVIDYAFECGVITMGGGGDYPRNVMCSPLSGIEKGEYFDVIEYAQAVSLYLLRFIDAPKMPRKLKVCFSNTPENIPHATYRDLGFVARKDGCFDVYSAGGLGSNPRFGVLVGEKVNISDILAYVKAMWLTFTAYGDYENRGRARTRYMQEKLGGEEGYKKAFLEKLSEAKSSGEDFEKELNKLLFCIESSYQAKRGENILIEHPNIIHQKQPGLYTVKFHPVGGVFSLKDIITLSEFMKEIQDVEIRLSPEGMAYIINLTAKEAEKVLSLIPEGAASGFESSTACIGASICQVGVMDSQKLLKTCIEAVRKSDISSDALPRINISGCPSSCGAHQTAEIGFRGGMKKTSEGMKPAFMLSTNGCSIQGSECFGDEQGLILESDIPSFIVELGKTVMDSGLSYSEWKAKNPNGINKLAQKYI